MSEQSWTIGRMTDCDLVVTDPAVSGRHCRLTWKGTVWFLEDLGSRNGTFVDGIAITTPTPVSRRQSITLGLSCPFPWQEIPEPTRRDVGNAPKPSGPAHGPQVMGMSSQGNIFGRDPQCDYPVDDPTVSWHHAHLQLVDGEFILTDLGSSNGTAVNDRKIDTPTAIKPGDTIRLGSFIFRFNAGTT